MLMLWEPLSCEKQKRYEGQWCWEHWDPERSRSSIFNKSLVCWWRLKWTSAQGSKSQKVAERRGGGELQKRGSCTMAAGWCFAREVKASVTSELGSMKRKQCLWEKGLGAIYNSGKTTFLFRQWGRKDAGARAPKKRLVERWSGFCGERVEHWLGCTWLTELESRGRRQEGAVCADGWSLDTRANVRPSLWPGWACDSVIGECWLGILPSRWGFEPSLSCVTWISVYTWFCFNNVFFVPVCIISKDRRPG